MGQVIANAPMPGLALFGAAIEKSGELFGDAAIKRATAECCGRFDVFLKRQSAHITDPSTIPPGMPGIEHGLVLFAEGRFDQRARVWVRDFRRIGTEAGVIERLSDIPYFVPAKESRLLQLADYVAHALFSLYERNDTRLIRPILDRFDTKDGILHGLKHVPRSNTAPCECPSCSSRTTPGDFGPWYRATATLPTIETLPESDS